MAFVAKDAKKHYTLGIVYEPNKVDTQGDYTDADEIEKWAWSYMRRLQGMGSVTKAALRILDEIVKTAESGETLRIDITGAWDEIAKGGGLNDMHVNKEGDEALGDVVECYVAPCDMIVGNEIVRKGSWCLGVVWSPEHFTKIESGERTGYSLEGRGRRVDDAE